MKKLKLLPSVLMLVACVAVLGVGVFAVAPTQNTISGSITINSTNPEVLISAYGHKADGTVDESKVIMTETPARSGININLGSLTFDTSTCNTEEDLAKLDVKVTIRVSNPSSTKLGVYFSDAPVADKAVSGNVATEKPLTDSTSVSTNVKAFMDGYKALDAKATNNGVCDTVITFKLSKFMSENATVDLSIEQNKMYLNIEEYQQGLDANSATVVGTSGQKLTADVVSSASGSDKTTLTSVKIADGVEEIGEEAFAGCTNLSKITIPSTVKFVKQNAFKDCPDSMFTIDSFGTSVKVKYIGTADNPYFMLYRVEVPDENDLPEIVISNSTKVVADYAYNAGFEDVYQETGNSNAIKLGNSIEYFGDYSFNIKGLTDRDLLTSFRLEGLNPNVKYIGNSAFSMGLFMTQEGEYIDITLNKIEYIGQNAFYNSRVGNVKISNTIKHIGENAFENTFWRGLYLFFEAGTNLDEEIKLPENDFDGYSALAGWYTNSSFEGEPVTTFKSCDTDTTLYAKQEQ